MHERTEGEFNPNLTPELTVSAFLEAYATEGEPVDEKSIESALGGDSPLLMDFLQQDIHTQARLIRQLEAAGLHVESVLRQANIAAHQRQQQSRLEAELADAEIDPFTYQFQRGHVVEFLIETHEGKVPRNQTKLFSEIWPRVADGAILGIKSDTETPASTGEDELLDLIHETIATLGGGAGFRVMSPLETEMAMMGATPDKYGYEFVRGVVQEVPNGNNHDMMELADGRQFYRGDIRVAAVVGADLETLLNRSEDEVYYGQRVRVWAGHDFGWVTGTVIDAGMPRKNMVAVRTDVPISDSEWLDGHGFTANFGGPSLDTRDLSKPPLKHPLEDYPGYEIDRCITVTRDGEAVHGFINELAPTKKNLRIETPNGTIYAGFDEGVTVWERPCGESGNTLAGIGDILVRYNAVGGGYEAFKTLGVKDGMILATIASHRRAFAPHAYVFGPDEIADMQRAPAGSFPKFHETFDGEETDVLFKKVWATFSDPYGRTLQGIVLSDGGYPFFLDIIVPKKDSEVVPGEDLYHRYSVDFNSIHEVIRKDKPD